MAGGPNGNPGKTARSPAVEGLNNATGFVTTLPRQPLVRRVSAETRRQFRVATCRVMVSLSQVLVCVNVHISSFRFSRRSGPVFTGSLRLNF